MSAAREPARQAITLLILVVTAEPIEVSIVVPDTRGEYPRRDRERVDGIAGLAGRASGTIDAIGPSCSARSPGSSGRPITTAASRRRAHAARGGCIHAARGARGPAAHGGRSPAADSAPVHLAARGG